MERVKRMWINQPSTLQPYHEWDGVNVIAHIKDSKNVTVFFLEGNIISMRCSLLALSNGWK